ncbi:5-methyltetrahydropteroyltriglutamate--homocysteine S-methyltransferase [Bacillus sp. JJ664]
MVNISNLGYPRIGENREWKKTLESFWKGNITEDQFESEMKSIRLQSIEKQLHLGIEMIPVNDFTYYDHVLDFATMFGWIPTRFGDLSEQPSLHTYFALARGSKDLVACEMTKWFNTNYHYIVPEYQYDRKSKLLYNKPLMSFLEVKNELGIISKPVILGIYTFTQLSKGYKQEDKYAVVKELLPVYIQMLKELEDAGVEWVQIDEPAFVLEETNDDIQLIKEIYSEICEALPSLSIMLQTYFEGVEQYHELIKIPVKGIGLDFVHGREENVNALRKYGFPKDKVLACGIVNGRNIWKNDLVESIQLIETLQALIHPKDWWIQPSCSLLHVPVTKKKEDSLEPTVLAALAFADEKIEELVVLKKALKFGNDAVKQEIEKGKQIFEYLNKLNSNSNDLRNLSEEDFNRALPFKERYHFQKEALKLPLLPTTTIGSFPQTKEIKIARQQWRKGELSETDYRHQIKLKIKEWIELQETLDLDVLVHGEYERTDMVEYFGEKLKGFAFTKNAWVQSYGSRCVKPPIIHSRVEFMKPMTVDETSYAQSLTKKPVKGMLTGPVTILNWSFVRENHAKEDIANEIALALRKEINALEESGISIIQVDEPAIREGLPLKKRNWEAYLNWVTRAFRLTTAGVQKMTQIHTHMCYSSFSDIMDAVIELDADVISIEHARSHEEFSSYLAKKPYPLGIGLGVYDIHSPRVPSVQEMEQNIVGSLKVCDVQQFWINPDCGLKTRDEKEVIQALSNMVASAKKVREHFYSILS